MLHHIIIKKYLENDKTTNIKQESKNKINKEPHTRDDTEK